MVSEQDHEQRLLRHKIGLLAFRISSIILLVAILWSVVQVVTALTTELKVDSSFQNRQENYSETATAIASSGQEQGHVGEIRLMQFATNTPDAASDPESAQAFPTNTPLATDIPAITALPVDNTVPDREHTPVALPTFFLPADRQYEQLAGTAVPTRVPVIPRDYELVNILLLGDDGEVTGDNSLRTDTMIVLSINTETESVAMLSLPRDLFVYIQTPTMTRLNTVYGIGEAFGWPGGGFGLMREAIFYNFGIQLHYFARVDLSGLRTIIDTLGGVEIAVDCAYQDYALVGADVPAVAEIANEEDLLYTLPIGYYHFTGGEALWFARTRNLTSDFDRGRRQQQLLRAIYRAARDKGQIADLPNLWEQLIAVVETDIPLDVAIGLIPIALNLDAGRIESFTFVHTYHTIPWQPTEGAFSGQFVQLPVYDPIHDLLVDFYQPPTSSQLEVSGPLIAVYNGSSHADWDRVASERLRSVGLNAYAAGVADESNIAETILIDYAGLDKGSPIARIQSELNISSSNIQQLPDPARTTDYRVILGENYTSCTAGVLPIEE